jgi:DNA mismatch repair protein MutS
MEKQHNSVQANTVSDNGGQISFGSLGREAALAMLERTNIDELSDEECRSLLKDMLEAME